MKTYGVYRNDKIGKTVVVPHGFNWFAFFFLFVWCLAKGLLVRGIILFTLMIGAGIGLAALAIYFGDFENASLLGDIILILLSIYVGWSANEWRAASLMRRGFVRRGGTEAASAKDALATLES
ncbi:MAG: DUF2628 domain-containing protein [Magnetospirillum sp. WYHS-4]